MPISTKTAKMLWGRAAARCAIPDCRHPLVVDETDADDEVLVGEMCHMVGESEDGPRGQSPLTRDQRDLYSNLILLCRNHHSEVDGQPATFTVERLKAIKGHHERWVREALPGFDSERQRDDEIYAGYIDEWARRCDLADWRNWSAGILGAGQPQLLIELDTRLKELGPWLLGRIWPGRYPSLENSFINFRMVLQDFRSTFHEHADKPWPHSHFTVL